MWRRIDRWLLDALHDTCSHPFLDRACPAASKAADRLTIWLVIASLLAIRPDLRGTAARGVLALSMADAAGNVIAKWIVQRPRPPERVRAERPGSTPDNPGFPSGHTAAAAAFATVLASGAPRAIGIPVTGLAVAVAYSRLYTGAHYPSDVAAGAVLGAAAAWLTCSPKRCRLTPHRRGARERVPTTRSLR